MAIDIVKPGVAVGAAAASGGATAGAGAGAGDILEPLAGVLKSGYEAIGIAMKEFPKSQMPEHAKALMEVQSQLMTSFVTSSMLWKSAQDGKLAQLPQSLGAVAVDPGLAWDNYMQEAENSLANMKLAIGDGSGSGEAQAAANDYLASLKILAQYGKAINAKFVAFTEQLARALVVKAQLAVAVSVQARWHALQAAARSDEEQLTALRGMIQRRTDAITRSIFVAWRNFRNAYYYMYFKEPSANIRVDMNAAQLKDAFANVAIGTANLLGDAPDSRKVRLPQENVSIDFSFDIVKLGEQHAEIRPARRGLR